MTISHGNLKLRKNQFTYDYVKLKIGYFSNRIPVWEGIFTLFLTNFLKQGTWVSDSI